MTGVMRRVRGVLGMGVIWAIGWAVLGGALMEGVIDPNGEIVDIWPVLLAIFGFLGGIVFGIVLGVAAGRRRFDELSVPQFTAFGALAGLLVGIFVMTMGAGIPALLLTTLGCAVSAAGSLTLAQQAARREWISSGTEAAELRAGEPLPRIDGQR